MDNKDAVCWARKTFPRLADQDVEDLLEAAAPPDPSVYSPMGKVTRIVVHHSATAEGSAAAFRILHRAANGWADIGYHYVIGNGTLSGDGEVEEGRPEWAAGAHSRGHNDSSIGICLVGDFTSAPPTAAQLTTLSALADRLLHRYGLTRRDLVGHSEMPGCRTLCPGDLLDLDRVLREGSP